MPFLIWHGSDLFLYGPVHYNNRATPIWICMYGQNAGRDVQLYKRLVRKEGMSGFALKKRFFPR
jgi:hypothetical protein